MPIEVTVGEQGRLVLPAALREELGVSPGERLVARVEQGRLFLEKPEAIIDRLRDRFTVVPPGVSLTDELIAERRAEAPRHEAP